MLKKTNLFILCGLALLCSCRTLHLSDYHTNQSGSEKIPGLKLLLHERSFGQSFLYGMYREVVFNPVYGPAAPGLMHVANPPLDDVTHALQNELQDHMLDRDGPVYGHARFRLSYYQVRNSGWGYTIPSIATLFVINLFGLPEKVMCSELELQLEITDSAGQVIAHYSASGTGKAKEALYYGYNNPFAVRKANLLAIQHAMQQIEQQVGSDASRLTAQLEAAGILNNTK